MALIKDRGISEAVNYFFTGKTPTKAITKKPVAKFFGVPDVKAKTPVVTAPSQNFTSMYQSRPTSQVKRVSTVIPSHTPTTSRSTPTTSRSTPTTSRSTPTGGDKVTSYQNDGTETQDQLDFLQKKQLGAISDQYDSEIQRLNAEQGRAQGAYDQSIGQAQSYYPQFQKLVGEQQTSTEGQIGNLENQRKYESERSLDQARQLLNDLNRRQYAQMSASGNYNSSVPEAFANQFGERAFAAQNQIQTSRDQALNDLSQKRVEAKQYFDQKLFEGKQKYDTLISGLQQQLNSQLDQIGNAKGQASAAKRAQSLEAWNNYVNNKFTLDQELRNYNDQLALYNSSLSNTSNNPFDNVNTSQINSAENQNILGQTQQNVDQGNINQPTNVPIIKRRIYDPTDPRFLYQDPNQVGLQLNPVSF